MCGKTKHYKYVCPDIECTNVVVKRILVDCPLINTKKIPPILAGIDRMTIVLVTISTVVLNMIGTTVLTEVANILVTISVVLVTDGVALATKKAVQTVETNAVFMLVIDC